MANGLRFPSNGEAPASNAVIFRFETPQSNGLPIWGPANAGVTYIWEVSYRQHTGYYVCWWYGPYSNFFWDGGSPNTYYGGHPYPASGGGAGTVHNWEIGVEGGDTTNTLLGSPQTVIKGPWRTQAMRVTYNGDNTKTLRFYLNLPSLENGNIIEHNAGTSYGNSYASDQALYFGDSGWTGPGNERMSGTLGRVKIFDKVLSETHMLQEAADMTQLTSGNDSDIWWGKTSFETVDDLTCDYGTGRAFTWVGSDKATLEVLPPRKTVRIFREMYP